MQTIKSLLISLRMLLESPNPKDPQDAEVAKLMLANPEVFARTAHEWAVKYAGAPRHPTMTWPGYNNADVAPKRVQDANQYVLCLAAVAPTSSQTCTITDGQLTRD